MKRKNIRKKNELSGCGIRYRRMTGMLLCIFGMISMAGAQPYSVASPNGALKVDVSLNPFSYQVKRNNAAVMESANLGVVLSTHSFQNSLTYVSHTTREINENYTEPCRRKAVYVNHCNEMKLTVSNGSKQLELYVRAYNEGIAYRYAIPGSGTATISDELSAFKFPGGTKLWGDEGWSASYELYLKEYSTGITGEVNLPILARTPDSTFILISEAAVFGNYCGSHVIGSGLTLKIKLADAPSYTLPWNTPWRVAVVGTLANAVENACELIDNLNPPAVTSDIDWIKPGFASWSWMAENVTSASQQMRYIDFSAECGFKYCLVDEGWPNFDVKPIFDYAKSKGIGILLWYRKDELDTKTERDTKLAQLVAWGGVGLKVDFISSDQQTWMKFYDDMTQAALDHKLMINFHGTCIPHGERRKYPNLMTREGVLGNEWYRNRGENGVTAYSSSIMLFTRAAIGMADFTPGTLKTKPHQTTNAQELALFVLIESGWQHPSDKPEDYRSQVPSVLPFFKRCPATWDDVKFIEGMPGTHQVLARRSGADWWIAGMNAEVSRTVSINLSFLAPGTYRNVMLYSDSGVNLKAHRLDTTLTVTSPGTFSVTMQKRGGFVMRIPGSMVSAFDGKSFVPVRGSQPDLTVMRIDRSMYQIVTPLGQGYGLQVFNPSGRQVVGNRIINGGSYLLNADGLGTGRYILRVTGSGREAVQTIDVQR